jgi:hypothetical protein
MRAAIPDLLSLAVRVAAGTALFVLVLVAVQSRDARVAGMMLTFPALNGISLMMAPVADKRAMARAMLAVIALNGFLGLAFIETFGTLTQALGAGAMAWVWPLSAIAFLTWLTACWILSRTAPAGERLVLWGFVVAVPLLIAMWWVVCPLARDVAVDGGDGGLITSHAIRIALFAVTLALLLVAAQWLGATHGLIGRLGAFPLLPLFSLATIAETTTAGQGGIDRLVAVRPAMLLGLLLAMAFAWIYSGYLMVLTRRTKSASGWWTGAVAGLIGCWIAVAGSIFTSMAVVTWLEGCR